MRRGSWRLQWLAVAALVAAGLAAVGVAQTAAGRSVLRSAGLSGSPPRYTELAFAAPMRLPTELHHTRARLRPRVLIHNLEGSAKVYRWRALEEGLAGGPQPLDSGSARVESGGWGTIRPRLLVSCGNALRVHVRIALASPPRSVGFWIECPRGLVHDKARQTTGSGAP